MPFGNDLLLVLLVLSYFDTYTHTYIGHVPALPQRVRAAHAASTIGVRCVILELKIPNVMIIMSAWQQLVYIVCDIQTADTFTLHILVDMNIPLLCNLNVVSHRGSKSHK